MPSIVTSLIFWSKLRKVERNAKGKLVFLFILWNKARLLHNLAWLLKDTPKVISITPKEIFITPKVNARSAKCAINSKIEDKFRIL